MLMALFIISIFLSNITYKIKRRGLRWVSSENCATPTQLPALLHSLPLRLEPR